MRLFLVPIAPGRTLLYCKRIDSQAGKNVSYIDRITNKAAETWARWEEADKGWKKSLVTYGHSVLQRIPYEEWGLKSVPPLSVRREAEELKSNTPVDLIYPGNVINRSKVLGTLRTLATERQDLHRRRMFWSIAISPLTAPIALIPIIPNIPFFYLVYRGWSHWRALNGSKHLQFLLDKNLVNPKSLPELENVYSHTTETSSSGADGKVDCESSTTDEKTDGKILLKVSDGRQLGKILGIPELVAEVERAVGQVKHQLQEKSKEKQG